MESMEQWIGINVCKRWLAAHIRSQGASFRVDNTDSGIQALLTHLKVPSAP